MILSSMARFVVRSIARKTLDFHQIQLIILSRTQPLWLDFCDLRKPRTAPESTMMAGCLADSPSSHQRAHFGRTSYFPAVHTWDHRLPTVSRPFQPQKMMNITAKAHTGRAGIGLLRATPISFGQTARFMQSLLEYRRSMVTRRAWANGAFCFIAGNCAFTDALAASLEPYTPLEGLGSNRTCSACGKKASPRHTWIGRRRIVLPVTSSRIIMVFKELHTRSKRCIQCDHFVSVNRPGHGHLELPGSAFAHFVFEFKRALRASVWSTLTN